MELEKVNSWQRSEFITKGAGIQCPGKRRRALVSLGACSDGLNFFSRNEWQLAAYIRGSNFLCPSPRPGSSRGSLLELNRVSKEERKYATRWGKTTGGDFER